eukprot:SAG22_NODE_2343_length_2686_cov_1.989563_2_plen_483_part_01
MLSAPLFADGPNQLNPLVSLLANYDIRALITASGRYFSLPTVCMCRRVCRALKFWMDTEVLAVLPQPTAIGGFSMVTAGHGLGKYLQNAESLDWVRMHWKVRPEAGMKLRRSDFAVVPATAPAARAGGDAGGSDTAVVGGQHFLVFGGAGEVNKKPIPWAERFRLGGVQPPRPEAGSAAAADRADPSAAIPLAPEQFRTGGCAATALADGRVVVIGPAGLDERAFGLTACRVDAFDPRVPPFGEWSSLAPLLQPRLGAVACTVQLPGSGKEAIFVAGGLGAGPPGPQAPPVPLGTAELYDPETDRWTPCTGTMGRPRWGAAAVVCRAGYVDILGGLAEDGAVLGCCELFSLAGGGFLGRFGSADEAVPLPPMARPRAFFGVQALPSVGAVVAFGGQREQCPSVRDAEVLDTRGFQLVPGQLVPGWRPLPSMVSARRAFGAVTAPAPVQIDRQRHNPKSAAAQRQRKPQPRNVGSWKTAGAAQR